MTNRQRVLAVLDGDTPDRVPFASYDWKFPWGYDKRMLRQRGLTMVNRYPGYTIEYPHCECRTICTIEDGHKCEREIVETPKGPITSLFLPECSCNVRLQKEFWLKSEADYEPLLAMISDAVVKPAYEEGHALIDGLGEDGVVYVWKGYSPLQEIMLRLIGIEQFCFELMERPDQLWTLYDALLALERKKTPIVLEAPGDMIQYCGNPIASILGPGLFIEKVLSCTNEFASAAHDAGRLVSMHVDGDNAIWAEQLAASKLDVIEAFTPAPDSDMTMAQARAAFPDKVIWANFPSSVHLADEDSVRTATREILAAVAPGERFILGITEDIPPGCWRRSLSAILDVLEREGHMPIG